jgi:hypothetical protein
VSTHHEEDGVKVVVGDVAGHVAQVWTAKEHARKERVLRQGQPPCAAQSKKKKKKRAAVHHAGSSTGVLM